MSKSKYRTLVSDTLVFALGNLGSKLIQFVLMPLYTGYMTTSEYGVASLVFTIGQFLLPILSVEIFDAVLRFGLSKSEKKENVLLIGLLTLVVDALLLVVLIPAFRLYPTIYPWRYYLIVYVFVSISNTTLMNYLKVQNRNRVYAFVSILQTLILALTSIYTIAYLRIGIEGYLISNIIALAFSSIIVVVLGRIFAELRYSRFDYNLLKRMLTYSSPLIFSSISWWLISSSDKIMIEVFIGAGSLGIYTAASKIPALINIFTSIFQQSWGISAIKEMESSNDSKFYSSILNIYQFLVFGASVSFLCIARIFMRYYVSNEFSEAIRYVPLLVMSAVFSALSTYFGALFTALKKSVNVMMSTLVGAIVNIIVNFILIQSIGLMGAVIGTLIAYFVINQIRLISIRKYVKIEINHFKYWINCAILFALAMIITIERDSILFSTLGGILFLINNYDIIVPLLRKFATRKNKR